MTAVNDSKVHINSVDKAVVLEIPRKKSVRSLLCSKMYKAVAGSRAYGNVLYDASVCKSYAGTAKCLFCPFSRFLWCKGRFKLIYPAYGKSVSHIVQRHRILRQSERCGKDIIKPLVHSQRRHIKRGMGANC